MEADNKQVCPWCDTEITWDPEIGPEETCPHCYNELGDYRVLSLDQLAPGEQEEQPKRGRTGRALDDEFMDLDGEEEVLETDPYDSAAQSLTDLQEEAPECPNCREFMLHAGELSAGEGQFTPAVPALLGQPLLPSAFGVQVYVCPSCFRVDHLLSEGARLALIEKLRKSAL